MKNSHLFKKFLTLIIVLTTAFMTIISLPMKAQQIIQSDQAYTDAANYDHQPCISKEMHEVMENRTQANIKKLIAEGTLFTNPQKTVVVTQTFAWPLTYHANFYDNEYYYIQNYIDHDPSTGPLLDYSCGDRTYDKPNGYDHTGTDICIGPYHWSMMDAMLINVIAAAAGQIVDKDDGNYDRNCGFGNGNPNYVKIMHSDGSYAIYYHMKSGSVTTKIIGEMVEAGEYLGLVGSSGSSTNPHLHFEVLDQNGDVVDPWVGSCNPDISSSLWKNQLPYYNPGILRLMTLSGAVPSSNCPDPEPLTIKNHFNIIDPVRLEIHLRDIVPALIVNLVVTDPAGSQVSVNFINTGSFSPTGFYYYNYIPTAGTGTYKMSVTYSGKSAAHYFTVGCPGAYTLALAQSGKKGYISGSSITSTSVISGSSSTNVWYEAESYILANPGFRATAGCTFTARINNCTVGGIREGEIQDEESITDSYLTALPSLANSESKLSFKLSTDDAITLSVYDLTGRKIQSLITGKPFKKGKHEVLLNTSTFISALYLIKIEGNQTKASCKLIVQH